MKSLYVGIVVFLVSCINTFAQNTSCADPDPFCASYSMQSFNINSSGADADVTNPGNNYGCLISQPRPSWFYLQIQNPGNLDMHMTGYDVSGDPVDVDFILYGPFTNLATATSQCNNYGNGGAGGSILDCSFSYTPDEDINITGATTGQVYILLVTGYSSVSFSYDIQQTGGTATTNCAIVNTGNCGETIYDIGGASGDYANDMVAQTILCPSTPGGSVTLNFTSFDFEDCCDHLYIYAGSGTGGTLIGDYQATSPGSITSNPAVGGGCLTLYATSDGSIVSSGYAANVICNAPVSCAISSISFGVPSICNNNGTPANPADDFFTVNVTVNYTNAPTTGNLVLSGGATASVPVSSIGSSSYTFSNVVFPANGSAASITATFSALSSCTLTNAAGPSVASCASTCNPNNGTWN